MVDVKSLREYFVVLHPDQWHSVPEIAIGIGFEGKLSEVEGEARNLRRDIHKPGDFSAIIDHTEPETVERPDADGPRFHYTPSMTPSDWHTVCDSYLSAALASSGGAVAENLGRAAGALESMRTKLLEG